MKPPNEAERAREALLRPPIKGSAPLLQPCLISIFLQKRGCNEMKLITFYLCRWSIPVRCRHWRREKKGGQEIEHNRARCREDAALGNSARILNSGSSVPSPYFFKDGPPVDLWSKQPKRRNVNMISIYWDIAMIFCPISGRITPDQIKTPDWNSHLCDCLSFEDLSN